MDECLRLLNEAGILKTGRELGHSQMAAYSWVYSISVATIYVVVFSTAGPKSCWGDVRVYMVVERVVAATRVEVLVDQRAITVSKGVHMSVSSAVSLL